MSAAVVLPVVPSSPFAVAWQEHITDFICRASTWKNVGYVFHRKGTKTYPHLVLVCTGPCARGNRSAQAPCSSNSHPDLIDRGVIPLLE